MTFRIKRKSKSKKFYKRNKRKRNTKKKYLNRRNITRKQRVMRGGLTQQERKLIKLTSRLTNQMFEYNKRTFKKKRNADNIIKEGIIEEDIDIIGPDYDPVENYNKYEGKTLLERVVDWHSEHPDENPPWQLYVGKLCEVPEGFFSNNERPQQENLQIVKQTPANFNPYFPRDPTNVNIVEIPFNTLEHANEQGKAVDHKDALIPQGTYKYALLNNDEIRFFLDTGDHNPYYYLPAVMLYFYNIDWISFNELKNCLGNELPHSFLFNAREKEILGAGDFTVDANGYIVELTGYSGHTKPLPSNVIYSAVKFSELGYPLSMEPMETIRPQTYNTDRSDSNDRLLGSYLSLKYHRPLENVREAAAAMPIANEEETNI